MAARFQRFRGFIPHRHSIPPTPVSSIIQPV